MTAAPRLSTESAALVFGIHATTTSTRYVPPINISNSGRADSLIRAGNLYLSLSDAIAMALENNIDVEVSRYGYPLQTRRTRSAQAGGNGAGVSYDPVLHQHDQLGPQRQHQHQLDHRRRTVGQYR